MKSFLVIFYILFSLGSSLIEQAEASTCSDEVMSAHTDHSCFTNSPVSANASSHPEKTCHDSNCFGSAHFGHGYYYAPKLFIDGFYRSQTFRKIAPRSSNQFISAVHLEGPFRPPLS